MKKKTSILWLEGVFDEHTVNAFQASSPAVNFFLAGFVRALAAAGCDVTLIGHPYDRIWPAGRVIVTEHDAALEPDFVGQVVGYINIPYLRRWSQSLNYKNRVNAYLEAYGRPDYVFTFNDSPGTGAAKYLSRQHGIPWIYLAGDGPATKGADGYIIQNWNYFESPSAPSPKIHLDGGLPLIDTFKVKPTRQIPRALMYMGALTQHGGALELARAFHNLVDQDIELWITGRGANASLEHLAASDARIKLYGFVEQEQLCSLASRAWIFANPRPTAFAPNKLNYPSKLLHYLAYGRPVLSTFTEGLSPDYREVLIPIEDETERGLAQSIHNALGMSESDYQVWCERVAQFNLTRAWDRQAERLLGWLEVQFKCPSSPA